MIWMRRTWSPSTTSRGHAGEKPRWTYGVPWGRKSLRSARRQKTNYVVKTIQPEGKKRKIKSDNARAGMRPPKTQGVPTPPSNPRGLFHPLLLPQSHPPIRPHSRPPSPHPHAPPHSHQRRLQWLTRCLLKNMISDRPDIQSTAVCKECGCHPLTYPVD